MLVVRGCIVVIITDQILRVELIAKVRGIHVFLVQAKWTILLFLASGWNDVFSLDHASRYSELICTSFAAYRCLLAARLIHVAHRLASRHRLVQRIGTCGPTAYILAISGVLNLGTLSSSSDIQASRQLILFFLGRDLPRTLSSSCYRSCLIKTSRLFEARALLSVYGCLVLGIGSKVRIDVPHAGVLSLVRILDTFIISVSCLLHHDLQFVNAFL